MRPFVPRDKMSKKQRKQLDSARRATWAVSPVTKRVESKKAYSRKRRPRDRYDGMGSSYTPAAYH